ncbi:MAG: heavy metal-binding domain-containing protein, partial [Acidimicrobiales bacterium]
MGRYGNVMLTAGQTNLTLDARPGQVVRFYLANTANTRLFELGIAGARLKLVGGDSGRYERETFVDNVLIAPSERAVIDVRFETSGTFPLEHRTPERTYTLGSVRVRGERIESPAFQAFETLRTSDELTRWRDLVRRQHHREPDKTLAFTSTMPLLDADRHESATSHVCPMHPDVTATEPGACRRCGMRLVASTVSAPALSAHHGAAHGHEVHAAETADGLEWEDLMPEMNAASDAHNMIWKLVDTATGKENGQIDWSFRVGDLVKIRLLNDLDQDHPMHHPFHIHGAGRFLVVARDAEVEPN